MARVQVQDRGVIEIGGDEAPAFLHNLVTNSLTDLEIGTARFAALLTPQGKIIADGFFIRTATGFLLDIPKALAADLAKKLTLYRLRAKITITDQSDLYHVVAGWDEEPPTVANLVACYQDPRLAELGWRAIVDASQVNANDAGSDVGLYHAHRIALGVPEGGRDFAYGDAFPHEADMDQLHGVDFKKGCYVGQEIVSRMQHRGTARTRAVPVQFHDGFAPAAGTSAEASGKTIGTIGSSVSGGKAVAILRLDKVEEAISAGAPLTAGGLAFSLETRPWIGFSVPRSK